MNIYLLKVLIAHISAFQEFLSIYTFSHKHFEDTRNEMSKYFLQSHLAIVSREASTHERVVSQSGNWPAIVKLESE